MGKETLQEADFPQGEPEELVLAEVASDLDVADPGTGVRNPGGQVVDASGSPESSSDISAAPRRHRETRKHLLRGSALFRRLVLVSDLASLVLAVVLGLITGYSAGRFDDPAPTILAAIITVPLWVVFAYAANLYHEFMRRVDPDPLVTFGRLAIVTTAWVWLFTLVRAGLEAGPADMLTSCVVWLSAIPILFIGRSVVRRLADRLGWTAQRTAIFGDQNGISALKDRIARHPEWMLEVGLTVSLDQDPELDAFAKGDDDRLSDSQARNAPADPVPAEESPILEKASSIIDSLDEHGVIRVIITGGYASFNDLNERTRFVQTLLAEGFSVDLVSGGPETVFNRALVHDYEGIPILSLKSSVRRRLSLALKRTLDVVVSLAGLILLSPLMLWAAVRIKLDSKGPVLYRQVRWGLDNQEFELVKFRTMKDGSHALREELRKEHMEKAGNGEEVLFKIVDDPRITPVGHQLRKWSIDEVPQLWNVLKGEMSMVGPRPLVPEEAARAEAEFAARTSVKPGIAGLWQALGRSSIPFEDMIRLDYTYVLSNSTIEDLKLLVRTTLAVFRRRGAI